ncbi:2-oxoglutarate synthase [Dethiosulfovibrio peptidovorans DSM 11002]|uniref:2-oxoglutarate synthase n=1 Tax=Dethiosulfovibrio peptidovorans DSM 11002 TaxID=469381 RepID=D2Z389_9BACT|nr:2-oxoacid:acceptor oxidoreductase family protein [Dethiosulfovibrio peptidovorans]EFC92129.1 2-oxoglutarate synthase [Dethiosulfovibrio peptidovorans DSM 11002]
MSDRFEIRFAGSGGQGVILASVVVGEAVSLYADGLFAVQTQSYGPEARGGSSKAEVVISSEPIDYPMPVQPNLQVILTSQACEKYATDTKPGGRLIIDDFYVKDIPEVDANIYHLPIVKTARDVIGRELVTNMVSLGMVARVLELEKVAEPEAIRKAILSRVPKGTEEMNGKAFDEGYKVFKNSQSLHF